MTSLTEKRVERELVKLVHSHGGLAVKLAPTVAGLPDRLVVLPGGAVWFIELKAPGKRVSPVQLVIHGIIRDLGANVAVLDSLEAVADWVSKIHSPTRKQSRV